MSRFSKALILGFVTGIVGMIISLIPSGLALEENLGLDLLFKLRGVRKAPSDVIVISLDKASADKLKQPENPERWSRSPHARLIENLIEEGAAVIAFDIFLGTPHSHSEDNLFAEAINKARNVVLCECLKSEKIPLTDKGRAAGDLNIVKLLPPIPIFVQSAVATAPFPLPKVPVKVSQYWMFKTAAGDTPTLPVVVFQMSMMQLYDEFIHLLEKVSPLQANKLPRDRDAILSTKSVKKLIQDIRDIFENEPTIPKRMFEELQNPDLPQMDVKKNRLLKSLIKMYQGSNTRFLNFYGPPGTITTVSYYQILRLHKGVSDHKQIDFKGKSVFVGLSDLYRPEQKDGFHTVFTQPDGVYLSGVEIAATAFANLLEDMPVQPLNSGVYIAIIFLWGILLGIICRLFPAGISALSVVGLSILYLITAVYQFKTSAIWYPLVIPVFLQSQIAFFGAVSWKYFDSIKERQNIKRSFKYYLPADIVDQLAKNIADLKANRRLVYGICLSTDAERYTSLSEIMEPEELSSFLDKYYETVFKPIKQHNGIVSNVIGDSALAVWITKRPGTNVRHGACLAALDIASAINQLKQSSDGLQLHTRIGLHSGNILFGSVGAVDHYEYRPVGDIVNTATRIEGLNKHLGTRILVSEEVIDQLDGLLTRELGKFLLAGKSKPIVIYELLCRMEESNEQQRRVCEIFAEALNAFRRQSWDEAIEKFSESAQNFGEDGPSHFYIGLCEHHKNDPTGELWEEVIRMDKK
jgi:adenylate cyclase